MVDACWQELQTGNGTVPGWQGGLAVLVLSRHVGESIVIEHPDGPIIVHVVEYFRGKLRLGVDAPKSVIVDRMEVHLRRKAAKGVDHAEQDGPAAQEGGS